MQRSVILNSEIIISNSTAQTESIGEKLAVTLYKGDIIAFLGDLGMGKTAFVRGLAKGLGCSDEVLSPTFTIINEYRGGRLNLCHMDAYRLNGAESLFETGFYDYCDNGWVSAIEWSENIIGGISPRFTISFQRIDDNTRKITITQN